MNVLLVLLVTIWGVPVAEDAPKVMMKRGAVVFASPDVLEIKVQPGERYKLTVPRVTIKGESQRPPAIESILDTLKPGDTIEAVWFRKGDLLLLVGLTKVEKRRVETETGEIVLIDQTGMAIRTAGGATISVLLPYVVKGDRVIRDPWLSRALERVRTGEPAVVAWQEVDGRRLVWQLNEYGTVVGAVLETGRHSLVVALPDGRPCRLRAPFRGAGPPAEPDPEWVKRLKGVETGDLVVAAFRLEDTGERVLHSLVPVPLPDIGPKSRSSAEGEGEKASAEKSGDK